MATAHRFQMPFAQPVNANGVPLAGARLYFYASGTSTLQNTYADAARTIPNSNPVVADSAGRFPAIFLGSSPYKVVLRSAADVLIRTDDPVSTVADLAEMIFSPSWAGSVSRTATAKLSDTVSVKDFGATGDGTTDDTAAIQAAFNWAVGVGADVRFPAGDYRVTSQLVVDSSAVVGENPTRVSVTGDGPGCTRIKSDVSSGPTLFFKGSENTEKNNAHHSFQRLADIRIEGTYKDRRSIAVYGQNLPFFCAQNVVLMHCEEGFRLGDVLSSVFINCNVRGNLRGFHATRMPTPEEDYESDPNAISFYSCVFGNNAEFGMNFVGGANINFFGGSIEGNGWASGWDDNIAAHHGPQPPNRWGVRITSAGREGGVGLAVYGTYFEGNEGNADVWIDQPDGTFSTGCAYSFVACNFHRNGWPDFDKTPPDPPSAYHVINNIRIDSANTPVALSVNGCGFRGVSPYVPSIDRPCIQLSHGKNCKASQRGNFFSHGADMPLWAETPTFSTYLAADQSIPNDDPQLLRFVKTEDYGNCWDDATYAFVAPENIRMRFSAQIHWTGTLASGDFISLQMRINNVPVRATERAATAGGQSMTLGVDIHLTKGDRVQLVARAVYLGASRTVYSDHVNTFFTGSPV